MGIQPQYLHNHSVWKSACHKKNSELNFFKIIDTSVRHFGEVEYDNQNYLQRKKTLFRQKNS